ncbi:hypothetical protein MOQ72_05165 [Saccharopolyspora sp. K220]|uniref:hypothetical protein n=1 Tax=Saccharopolyspora soli TaxID=2926618 RepID=UPI001F5A0F0E|nr:hypothetical protein [Saccharopolyspora soli]MCI2416806.1 hypothetical protein [Saccharopolyspora soli]
MPPHELNAEPQWRRTGNPYFPAVATVDGRSWVLRRNRGFPDHAMWTLFINGAGRFDMDDFPPAWGKPTDQSAPLLDARAAEEVLAPVRDFVVYGSEVGDPCDDFCCG